jgi:hypothetical protein
LLYSALRRGAIAQLGERLNGIQKVRGSNPLSSTKTPPLVDDANHHDPSPAAGGLLLSARST